MKRYHHLLAPIRIGNNIIKNRMILPNSSPHYLQGPETAPSDGYMAYLSGVARNGAAIVTVADWNNEQQRTMSIATENGNDASQHMQFFDEKDPGAQNYLSAMADEVHFYGARILLSTERIMPDGYTIAGGRDNIVFEHVTKPIPKSMIPDAIEEAAQRIKKYQGFGYDGLAIRVDYIMCARDRDDEYGGSVENRTRYVRQFLQRVRELCGRDFILETTIAGAQPHGYDGSLEFGYSFEETVEYAKLVEGLVDIITIREDDLYRCHPLGYSFRKGEHNTIAYCAKLKEAGVTTILSASGGFQDPDEMERYLAEGKCDMFTMARAFYCDSEYGEKLYDGRGEDIRPCLWCNKCHGTILPEGNDPWISVCSVNPEFGMQQKLPRMIREPGKPRKIAVIGGGPAGMQAAITCSERGHTVTLFEKNSYLGGQLIHSESFRFKWPIRDYKNWLIRRLGQLGVDVRLNTLPTPDQIKAGGYDAVFAATGAKPVLPGSIQGLVGENGDANYPTCYDVFGRESELGHRVVIVGGSEVGVETGMYLAENGHDVTILTRQDELAKDASHLHYITWAFLKDNPDGKTQRRASAWEKYDNLRGILEVTTKKVEGGTVTFTDKDGVEHCVEGDSIVICGGSAPCVEEALAYAGIVNLYFAIGDCNRGGNIQLVTRDAWSKACML